MKIQKGDLKLTEEALNRKKTFTLKRKVNPLARHLKYSSCRRAVHRLDRKSDYSTYKSRDNIVFVLFLMQRKRFKGVKEASPRKVLRGVVMPARRSPEMFRSKI